MSVSKDLLEILRCPNCDTPLTLHVEEKERLLCHHCGHAQPMPRKCPQCGSQGLRAYAGRNESRLKEMVAPVRLEHGVDHHDEVLADGLEVVALVHREGRDPVGRWWDLNRPFELAMRRMNRIMDAVEGILAKRGESTS